MVSSVDETHTFAYLPNTFEMHGSDLYYVARFLALQDAVTTTSRHASHIEELCAVNHVVILAPCHANTVTLNLEAQATLILPQSRCHSGLHARRRDLPSRIEGALKALLWRTWRWLRTGSHGWEWQ
jgi:hypothetical protein